MLALEMSQCYTNVSFHYWRIKLMLKEDRHGKITNMMAAGLKREQSE